VANSLAFYNTELITTVESFIGLNLGLLHLSGSYAAPLNDGSLVGANVINLFFTSIYNFCQILQYHTLPT
jgi:hypothetical protein